MYVFIYVYKYSFTDRTRRVPRTALTADRRVSSGIFTHSERNDLFTIQGLNTGVRYSDVLVY